MYQPRSRRRERSCDVVCRAVATRPGCPRSQRRRRAGRAPAALSAALGESAVKGPVGADLRRTPAALCNLIVEAGGTVRDDDSVARSRWRKHPAEVEAARKAHVVDAAAVVKLIAWLVQTVPQRIVTEFEVAQRLQELRAQHSAYIAPSMPAMAASGLSGAQPHYVPRRHHSRRLNDHPIF